MAKACWPGKVSLQCPVEVWFGLGARGKPQRRTQVVPSAQAIFARCTVEPRLDGCTSPHHQCRVVRRYIGTYGDNISDGLVPETHGVRQSKVAIAAMAKIVKVGACETVSATFASRAGYVPQRPVARTRTVISSGPGALSGLASYRGVRGV